ncbi:MAG: hypothetical protein LUG99_23530 [Lachnospiraceae bacterium]|nr:hypothetical protein [Lachnospiraceae bacterium]
MKTEHIRIDNLIEKINRRIRYKWVSKLRNTELYKYCYKSYWHCLLMNKGKTASSKELENCYFAARPNPGAGIGHQMANWIAGYWFAGKFGLKFAHIPFSSDKWEHFLGFYQGEKTVDELKKQGYNIVKLQKFDENDTNECERIVQIIRSYAGKKVVFLAEQDQFYSDQYGVINAIQDKFYSAPARADDKLIYKNAAYNIAIHVRRGDIMQNKNNENLSMRYQGNDYFVNALKTALGVLKDKNNVQIYLFSQGKEEDYPEFSQFENLHFCLDMGAQDSFLHMVYADALITSKSSFSYKPALLNKGIKFCPADFWHGYPDSEDWILIDDSGQIER